MKFLNKALFIVLIPILFGSFELKGMHNRPEKEQYPTTVRLRSIRKLCWHGDLPEYMPTETTIEDEPIFRLPTEPQYYQPKNLICLSIDQIIKAIKTGRMKLEDLQRTGISQEIYQKIESEVNKK